MCGARIGAGATLTPDGVERLRRLAERSYTTEGREAARAVLSLLCPSCAAWQAEPVQAPTA
jgi:hypothetical protein